MERNRSLQFHNRIPILIITSLVLLASCSPSQKSMDATRTQVAGDIYGTQTVLAPTATVTLTPTITNTPLPSKTPIPPTRTSGPTSTPLPPTPTLDAEGIEEGIKRMKLCYKAAVIVYADKKALFMDDAWYSTYGHPDEEALRALQSERKSRYQSLVQNVETCVGELCWDEDVLSVDEIIMESADCLGYENRINKCNTFLQEIKITGGVGMTPGQSANMMCGDISDAVQAIQDALLTVHGVDQEELDTIADPIWQNVHTRYDVVIP